MDFNIKQKIEKERKIIEEKIKKLGYESLRVSVFNNKNENRQEWQTRIDYDYNKNKYYVYSLADRAGIMGKVDEYQVYQDAENEFFRRLTSKIENNKFRVEQDRRTDYPSPLWDK